MSERAAFSVDAGTLLKARAATEGDKRFIYVEPSNENRDIQGERVLQKALAASADYFMKFGNVDIGHFSMPLVGLQLKLPDFWLYEIGKPVEIKFDPITVKAEIYSGDGPVFERAEQFWKSNAVRPWFPSVGGATLEKHCDGTGCDVTETRWSNIGMWREPINTTVKAATLMPIGAFLKALTAGAGSDTAALVGGAALRRESLHGAPIYQVAATLWLKGECPHASLASPTLNDVVDHFRDCGGMATDLAATAAEVFLDEVDAELKRTARLAA